MPRLVASTLELQDLNNGYWFEIREGGLDAVPTVRGEDTVIPGRSGQVARSRIADTLPVTLHGFVWGASGTQYRTRMAALRAIFSPTALPFSLTIHPDAVGNGGRVGTGTTATLNVRCLRFTGPAAVGDQVREFEIECVCIDSPPQWVIA